MNFLETLIISICGTLAIILMAYLAGRNFALGVLHQIAEIVKKIEGQTVETERKENK